MCDVRGIHKYLDAALCSTTGIAGYPLHLDTLVTGTKIKFESGIGFGFGFEFGSESGDDTKPEQIMEACRWRASERNIEMCVNKLHILTAMSCVLENNKKIIKGNDGVGGARGKKCGRFGVKYTNTQQMRLQSANHGIFRVNLSK